MGNYIESFLQESKEILASCNVRDIERIIEIVVQVKEGRGRIFFVGSGGGAGHASHATCDFRKILGIESYCVSDNVSELTARVNDENWDAAYSGWLSVSNLNKNDCLFVISVGGGSTEHKLSTNLVNAMILAKSLGSRVVGIVGRDGGFLSKVADAALVIPTINPRNVTAQVEGLQALIWHLIVTHPDLNGSTPKWESTL